MMNEQNMLEVRNLTKHFKVGSKQIVHAVDGVSFTLKKGKTLGLVGESGCGKSTCARTIIRMYAPTSGQILLNGEDITELKQKQLPVIVLSTKDGIDDRVALLNEGADDYLCKPFDLKELKARIQVQLRKRMSKQEHAIAVDGVVLLPDFCHLEIQGMKIRLTRHEYRILELLMRDVKRARTKKEIYEYAWEDDYLGDDKTINVHISNIRSKLHAVSKQEYIETIWGIGFKWKD